MQICKLLGISILFGFYTHAFAAETSGASYGAYIDTYYAYDFSQPQSFDRQFTTQAARHNEFNINLAYIEAKLERPHTHGRLALQAGTSVQSNYAGEPTIGSVSGPSLSRNLQEAYAGYLIGTNTWVDAGIMFSHIGLESFISKDNLTYTRSLVAEYTPYYQTGIRLSTKLSESLSAQLLVLNGWQNISENNSQKAAGTQLSYSLSPSLSITYNTYVGTDASFRHFHDLVLKLTSSDYWTFGLQMDVGFQNVAPSGTSDRSAFWSGFSLISKYTPSKGLGLSTRVEEYSDPRQVLISSSNGHAFRAWGASIGADSTLDSGIMWRNEVRSIFADQPVFNSRNGAHKTSTVAVSSLSVAF